MRRTPVAALGDSNGLLALCRVSLVCVGSLMCHINTVLLRTDLMSVCHDVLCRAVPAAPALLRRLHCPYYPPATGQRHMRPTGEVQGQPGRGSDRPSAHYFTTQSVVTVYPPVAVAALTHHRHQPVYLLRSTTVKQWEQWI